MKILFLDESGTPPRPDQQTQRYFVIAGAIVPEASWTKLRDALLGMKIRRKIRGELKWRYFAPGNNEAQNPMRALDQGIRDLIRTELYQMIASDRSIILIAGVCSIPAAYAMASINDQQGIYNLTYKVITERFQYFLQDLKRETGVEEYGLIIADHRGREDDKRLRAHHQMLVHSTAAFTSKYPNILESLLLQPSNLSIGIQFADIVAGAVWRKFERNDDRWFNLIEASFRKSATGQIDGYGIVKVPKAGWV
jgi:hypothetical protein